MANAINLNGIPTYVDESKEELIAKTVLGSKSQSLFNLMTGVKGATALHTLTSDIILQSGSSCGFDPLGTQSISQRVMTPAVLKVNMEYCEKTLLNTYAAHNLKLAAGKETLPYEEKFIGDVVAHVNAAIEKMIYQGDNQYSNQCDGLVKILGNSGAISETRKSTIWETLKAVYAAMPETVITAQDAAILVSPADFRAFVQELVAGNLYHYNENDKDGEIYLPGTNCKVIMVNGLAGTQHMIGCALSNIYVGVDMADDAEEFDFWYSKDDRIFKLAIVFAIGTQVAFPDEVVLV